MSEGHIPFHDTSAALFTGDTRDDDGQAIDSYFEAPEWIDDAPTVESEAMARVRIPRAQRIITANLRIPAGATVAAMLIPPDVNRKNLRIQTFADYPCYISSESFTIPPGETGNGYHPVQAFRFNGGLLDMGSYTGAVWVCGLGDGFDVVFDALSMTDGESSGR